MKQYNWQQKNWPHFTYDLNSFYETLLSISEKIGRISGQSSSLDKDLHTEALINLLVEEAIKTSAIEGEYISRPDVRSSIIKKLGLKQGLTRIHDKRAQGIVDMMFDVRETFKQPLSDTTLFEWHILLLSSSRNSNLRIGTWRSDEEPMQIVSGYPDREKIHFEAPPAKEVPKQMNEFIAWFNETAPGNSKEIKYPPIRAAIAHLYFESIHPFDDGNGRIGRAIAEKALSQGYGYPIMMSLSQAIEADKKSYYKALNMASYSNEITLWIKYFVTIILKAQNESERQISFILKKAKFFDKYQKDLNERQLKVLRRMFQEGIKGFEGGMSAKKYITIAETSKATATRDLQHLLAIKALRQLGSGRSVRYELVLTD